MPADDGMVPPGNQQRSATGDELQHEMDVLFEEWQEQEAVTDLSDLRPADSVVFILFWLLFFVVFLQFWTRYVLNSSLGWTEEIARFLLILVTFVGSVTAMRKGSHIAVEALLVFLPARAKHWTLVVIDGVVAAFCGAMAWYAWQLGNLAPGYMVSIDVPKGWIYWAVAAGLAGMTIHAIARFWRRLRGVESDAQHNLVLD